jgi:hypothetical protein
MSGFAADWLRRREPLDARARDADLARRYGAALGKAQPGPRRIVDLAAGTGANFRVLAPLLGGDQDWLLVDNDPALLDAQSAAIADWARQAGWHCRDTDGGVLVETGNATWRARPRRLDLARFLENIDLAACDGVTTTAFLDLVSKTWLEKLSDWLARFPRPLLATLTVDGRRAWQPALPADARILEAFQRHQSGDKGFGPALGAGAVSGLADHLAVQGFSVMTARSDWRVGGEARDLLLQMAEESATVACETEPADSALFAAWLAERSAQIRAGLLTLDVGHLDLLAIPIE